MTQRDNCGSRLLQPLVSVTKIGTQVSCHSKSLFFRSLSIKQSGPHVKMPQGEERGPSQGGGRRPGKQNPSVRAAGGIQINKKIEGRGGVEICLRLQAEEDGEEGEGESHERGPTHATLARREGGRGRSCPRMIDRLTGEDFKINLATRCAASALCCPSPNA